MKQEITKALADGAVTLAVGGGVATKLGWFAFINVNAPALGFIASCVFGVVATFFYFITYSKSTQADENKTNLINLKQALDEHKTETNSQFNSLNEGVDKILNEIKDTTTNN